MIGSDNNSNQKTLKVSLDVYSDKESIFWATLQKLKCSNTVDENDLKQFLETIHWERSTIELPLSLLTRWYTYVYEFRGRNKALKNILGDSFEFFVSGHFGFSLLKKIQDCLDEKRIALDKDDVQVKSKQAIINNSFDMVYNNIDDLQIEESSSEGLKIKFPLLAEESIQYYVFINGNKTPIKSVNELYFYLFKYSVYIIDSQGVTEQKITSNGIEITKFVGYRIDNDRLVPGDNSNIVSFTIPIRDLKSGEYLNSNSKKSEPAKDLWFAGLRISKILDSMVSRYYPKLAKHTKYILVGYLLVVLGFLDSEDVHNESGRDMSYHDYVTDSTRRMVSRLKFQ